MTYEDRLLAEIARHVAFIRMMAESHWNDPIGRDLIRDHLGEKIRTVAHDMRPSRINGADVHDPEHCDICQAIKTVAGPR